MRILIEVSGGVVQNVVVENYPDGLVGKCPEIILADYDNLNGGDAFSLDEYTPERKTHQEFDDMLAALVDKFNSVSAGDDRDQT